MRCSAFSKKCIDFRSQGSVQQFCRYESIFLNKLRKNNISCELYPSNDKLKKQLSYANKKCIPYVVIIGPEEFKEKKCIIKNMVSGEQLTFTLKDLYLRLKEILKV